MPATSEKLFRRVAEIQFSENSEFLVDIPRVQDIMDIYVRVSGSVIVGTAAGTAVPAESPAGIISRVDFVANGKDVLDQLPFTVASLGNYERRFPDLNTAPLATVATHAFEAVAYLDRQNFDGPRPKDSAFQAYLTNLLQLRITTGALSDIITPDTTTTLTASGITIEVYVHSINDITGKGEAKAVKKVTYQSEIFSGANSNYRFRVPVGNTVRLLKLHATDSGEPSDVLINSIQFAIDGVDVRHNASWVATRHENSAAKQLHLASVMPAGFAIIDSNSTGKLSNGYDLTSASLAEVILDVAAPSGTGKVEMVVEEFIMPVKKSG